MKERISSIIVFFFAFFGGIFFLKTSFYRLVLQKEINYESEVSDAAFIAIFVAILWVLLSGYRFRMEKLEDTSTT